MDGYIPGQEREPITTEQKVAMVGAVIASIFLFISAIAVTRWATPLFVKLNFGILPLGILQFVLGFTYLMNPKGEPAKRPLAQSRWARLLVAIMSFVLGTAIVVVWYLTRGGAR